MTTTSLATLIPVALLAGVLAGMYFAASFYRPDLDRADTALRDAERQIADLREDLDRARVRAEHAEQSLTMCLTVRHDPLTAPLRLLPGGAK